MGLFASDNYWHTDWDQYLHSETFLEDVPPLVGQRIFHYFLFETPFALSSGGVHHGGHLYSCFCLEPCQLLN